MDDPYNAYRSTVSRLADQWLTEGLPSRQGLDQAADDLDHLRDRLRVCGICRKPPAMVTATLDDGLGQGLAVIERFASVIGMRLMPMGLLQPPEAVVETCRRHLPAYLGLTVLHFDSEDDLALIARDLPATTRIIAGGPVFAGDADFARRTGVHFAARNVAAFLRYMVDAAATC